jgi:hypothetical protein
MGHKRPLTRRSRVVKRLCPPFFVKRDNLQCMLIELLAFCHKRLKVDLDRRGRERAASIARIDCQCNAVTVC